MRSVGLAMVMVAAVSIGCADAPPKEKKPDVEVNVPGVKVKVQSGPDGKKVDVKIGGS